MKTTGLNFIEAVQALADRKCNGVKREGWTPHIMMDCDFAEWSDESRSFKAGYEDFLATDWLLVDPIIPTEERTTKIWEIVSAEGECRGVFGDGPPTLDADGIAKGYQVVELTGTYRIPVKEKVQKQAVVANAKINSCGTCHYQVCFPQESRGKTGTLTFTWDEED